MRTGHRRVVTAALALALAALSGAPARPASAAGPCGPTESLDLGWSTDGRVETAIGAYSIANDVAVQGDGRIVVVGETYTTEQDLFVARYLPDGTLDTSFDDDGWLTVNLGSTFDLAGDVAIQSDGRIVVVGNTQSPTDIVVLRLNADGSPDTTFGTGGRVVTDAGGNDLANDLTIQRDGRIVVAGATDAANPFSGDYAILAVRYLANGSLDTSFDGDGLAVADIGAQEDSGQAVAVHRSGRILVAGYHVAAGNSWKVAVVAWNADGTLDTSWDLDGIVTTDVGAGDGELAYAIVLQPNKVVVAGSGGGTGEAAVLRYNSDGSLDARFGGGDGIAVVPVPGATDTNIRSVAVLSGGKILISGSSNRTGQGNDFMLLRLTSSGLADTAFDADGFAFADMGGYDFPGVSAVQRDGRVVVAGTRDYSTVAVARFCG